MSSRHRERVVWLPRQGFDAGPFTIPAVRQLIFLAESEAALSFRSSLAPLVILDALRGDWGMRRTARADLDLVQSWQGFLGAPERWRRHLVGSA